MLKVNLQETKTGTQLTGVKYWAIIAVLSSLGFGAGAEYSELSPIHKAISLFNAPCEVSNG